MKNRYVKYLKKVIDNPGIKIERGDNFFTIGGNSILAMKYGERKYFNNYKFQNNYTIGLKYNNFDKIINIDHIKLIQLQIDHFNMLNEVEVIFDNIVSWYFTKNTINFMENKDVSTGNSRRPSKQSSNL